MDANVALAAAAGLAALAALVAVWALIAARRRAQDEHDRASALARAMEHLAGRMAQLGEAQSAGHNHVGERLQAQERAIARTLEDRLSRLHERLAVIDAAQKNITELSARMVSLQDILSNKQARGAFGEVQMADIITAALPPDAYGFQVRLSNGRVADCMLRLPNPPGDIALDAKFPLESFQAYRDAGDEAARKAAARAFAADVTHHVRAIAERYIIPGETAESALMFLPSEAVYAELHASFRSVVEEGFARRVWIVSPTTLMATLNTVRAILRDARMREEAGRIQAEVGRLLEDVARLDERAGRLQRHFRQAEEDLRQIRVSGEKLTRRGERIRELDLGEDPPEEVVAREAG